MNENDLLTEFEIRKKRSLYSKLSIVAALIAIVLICYDFIVMPDRLKPGETPDFTIIQAVAMGIVVFSIAGIGFSIASLVRREKPTYIKVVGATLNGLLFLLLATGIVLAILLDNR